MPSYSVNFQVFRIFIKKNFSNVMRNTYYFVFIQYFLYRDHLNIIVLN